MIRKRRGQAAIEFLMTYGWALLIISIGIGAFTYIQISPSNIVGASCVFTDDIECFAHTVSTTMLTMELKNNAGRPISIDRIDCTTNTHLSTSSPSTTIPTGEMRTYNCNIPPAANVIANELTRINVVIYYTVDGLTFPRTTEGNVIGYVI